ncbi:MAB_1171c family putative transporter [Nocardia takedensis]
MITVVVAVAAARWRLVHHTPTDRLINRSLAWLALGMFLHVQTSVAVNAGLLQQLSLGAVLAVLSGIFGVTSLWNGADPSNAQRRQRRYDLAFATVFALLLVVGTPARAEGVPIDRTPGSTVFVFWTLFGAALVVCAVRILSTCVREARSVNLCTHEKLVYASVFFAAGAIAVDAVYVPVVAALSNFTGLFTYKPRNCTGVVFFAAACTAALVTAIPMIKHLLGHLEWDRSGRDARRLLPLWRDLTAIAPHLVLHTAVELAEQPPTPRIHRMSIEIHDTLLHLRAYMPVQAPTDTVDFEASMNRYAHALAYAVAAKRDGADADPDAITRSQRMPSGHSGHSDLLTLARHWSAVRATPKTASLSVQ